MWPLSNIEVDLVVEHYAPDDLSRLISYLLSQYLNSAGEVDQLSMAEEVALAQKIESGEVAAARLGNKQISNRTEALKLRRAERQGYEAKKQLLTANLHLVASSARRYADTYRIDVLDLVQECIRGLTVAVDQFDWREGLRFSSYATWWIRESIIQVTRDIAIPKPFQGNHIENLVLDTLIRLKSEFGREPSISDIAKSADISSEDVEWVFRELDVSCQDYCRIESRKPSLEFKKLGVVEIADNHYWNGSKPTSETHRVLVQKINSGWAASAELRREKYEEDRTRYCIDCTVRKVTIQQGKKAELELCTAYLQFISMRAYKRSRAAPFRFLELIEEGIKGMYQAVNNYNQEGIVFGDLAKAEIKKFIMNANLERNKKIEKLYSSLNGEIRKPEVIAKAAETCLVLALNWNISDSKKYSKMRFYKEIGEAIGLEAEEAKALIFIYDAKNIDS